MWLLPYLAFTLGGILGTCLDGSDYLRFTISMPEHGAVLLHSPAAEARPSWGNDHQGDDLVDKGVWLTQWSSSQEGVMNCP